MTAAIFGLVGVIIGGLLNGLLAFGFERRREASVFRLVARELVDDLTFICGLIDRVGKDGDWIRWANALNAGRLELDWRQRRPFVAQHLEFPSFLVVSQAIRGFEMMRDESPHTKERAEAVLTEDDRKKLTHTGRELFNALRQLAAPSGMSKRPSRARRLIAWLRDLAVQIRTSRAPSGT